MIIDKTKHLLYISILIIIFFNIPIFVSIGENNRNFTITSPAFKNGQEIPIKYTCEGKNISPPIKWFNIPKETNSLALIVEDPDAPAGIWVHWIIYNIPPNINGLTEQAGDLKSKLPKSADYGINSWKNLGYDGPCPPSNRHRYIFRLYALDKTLKNLKTPTKSELKTKMKGHIISVAKLIGTYERKKSK
ncbi:MAG: YbhB/YbcL family Raf kinase inhibitor-like protein [Deferribacterota bacterium]|nr:YbhB/YbcL family Raf kinase inhibitor-like protein [Deferribacterota bacterium]